MPPRPLRRPSMDPLTRSFFISSNNELSWKKLNNLIDTYFFVFVNVCTVGCYQYHFPLFFVFRFLALLCFVHSSIETGWRKNDEWISKDGHLPGHIELDTKENKRML
jgi:hypothetical protein